MKWTEDEGRERSKRGTTTEAGQVKNGLGEGKKERGRRI